MLGARELSAPLLASFRLRLRSTPTAHRTATMATADQHIAKALDILPEIQAELAKLEDAATPPKTILKKCFKSMTAAGLMYTLRIPPEQLCVHFLNRYGVGLNPHEVHRWISSVLTQGFDVDVIEGRPTATEMPPQLDLRINTTNVIDVFASHQEFNLKLLAKSDGLIAELGDHKYNSLCAGHTNAGLKAFKLGAKASEVTKKYARSDGNLSMDILQSVSPEMHACARDGLEWKVIRCVFISCMHALYMFVSTAALTKRAFSYHHRRHRRQPQQTQYHRRRHHN